MMTKSHRSSTAACPEKVVTYLRVNDQISIALLMSIAVLCVAVGFGERAWSKGGLTHIDRMPRNMQEFRVNLNEADWTEIAALPTIGEVMAKRVVAFRDSNGQINALASLAQIKGIGPKTLTKIEPFISDFPSPDPH